MSEWQAQVLVAGEASGEALLLTEALSLWGGLDPATGRIIDQRHPQRGQQVTGKIMVLPAGRGSSSASSILLEAVRQGTGPAGLITASADGILALGAVVAQEIYGQAPAVVVLAPEAYTTLSQQLTAAAHQLQISREGLVQIQ